MTASFDSTAVARELADACASRRTIATPSSRYPDFDVAAAYAVEAELVRLRRATGRATVGRKVGFASKALWRVLKLDTVVWAHMYDDTVHYARGGEASLSIARMYSPRIEPEIMFKVARPIDDRDVQTSGALDACEWVALGFEIIDCVYPDWQFRPADFVAAYGLHAALIVGEPRPLTAGLADELARFTVKLSTNGEVVENGSGRNVLRSPALCLAELAASTARHGEPLAAGEIISTGTLTESKPIAPGEVWSAAVDGIDLPAIALRIS